MTTYAEKNDAIVTDWNLVLNNWGDLDIIPRLGYVELSEQWVTCACGNLYASIPRYSDGEPIDSALRAFGVQFCNRLKEGSIVTAKETLRLIEKRSIEILATL